MGILIFIESWSGSASLYQTNIKLVSFSAKNANPIATLSESCGLLKTGVFSNEELCLKFLQARDTWFKSTLEEIPKENGMYSDHKYLVWNQVSIQKFY